jgi:hypothetical protein
VSIVRPDVLAVGSERSASTKGSWRGTRPWLIRGLVAVVVVAAIVAAFVDLGLWRAGPPATDVRLLTTGPDGLAWVDVDSGTRTPVAIPDDLEWTDPVVVGDDVVVRYISDDPILADRVVAFGADEQAHDVGEADSVVAQAEGALWLVVDGEPPVSGEVALTTPLGQWRSHIFSLPAKFDVVGAIDDGLVVARGETRYRKVILWDVQLHEVVRSFDLVVGVREVAYDRALVTTGCLISGCCSAVIYLISGRSTDVEVPAGYAESGAPSLLPEGIALVVVGAQGRAALAIGSPQNLSVVDLADVEPTRGEQVLPAPNGWLAIPTANGDVTLWHAGVDLAHLPSVQLPSDERVVGVTS